MKRKRFTLGLVLIMAVSVLTSCGYNTMQGLEEEVFGAWGDLEATLQRRADLIPNLVSTVKGYAGHEKQTLTAVIEARAKATQVTLKPGDLSNPKAVQQFQQAQGEISSALSRLMVVVERYPELKADRHFSDLMNQLEGTENRINVARQRYNQAVKDFNFAIRKFPYNITNNILLNLERKEYFEADAEAKKAPKVEF
jgi:LemA protein